MRTQFYVPRSGQSRAQLPRTTAIEPISQVRERILACSYLHASTARTALLGWRGRVGTTH